MARHNYASIYAVVCKEPLIETTEEGKRAYCIVKTIMSERDIKEAGSGYQLRCVPLCIHSTEDKVVEIIETLQINDVIEVIGFIATQETDKSHVCPACGALNYRREACVPYGKTKSGGTRVYLYPIAIRLENHYESEQTAFSFLRKNNEFANHVFLLGNLTVNPIQGTLQEGTRKYTRYQIAINRKYCPRGSDQVFTRTDYPWIYSYGIKSDDDFEHLQVGSKVYIDGAFQARKYKEQYICTRCGEEFDVPGRTLEILAYATEYWSDSDETEKDDTIL